MLLCKFKLPFFLFILFLAESTLAVDIFAGGHKILHIDNKLTLTVEISSTKEEMELGLGYRESLKSGTGMLFVYKQAGERLFWMKGMRFGIDIIWIRNKKIVHIEKNIKPPPLVISDEYLINYGHGFLADQVLEINGGLSEEKKIKVGDSISIE